MFAHANSLSDGHRRKLRVTISKYKDSNFTAEVIEERTALRNRLLKFRRLQRVFQPEVIPLLASQDALSSPDVQDDDNDLKNTSLYLPSSLQPDILAKTSPKLVWMERELRHGQCQDALTQLQNNLHAWAQILKDKYVNVRHQVPNTRSRSFLDHVTAKIDTSADKYRTAYAALITLDPDPNSEWRSELRPLHQQDLRSMSEANPVVGSSTQQSTAAANRGLLPGGIPPEGSRTISWIWWGALDDEVSSTPGFNKCMYTQ